MPRFLDVVIDTATAILKKIGAGAIADGFTLRDLHQKRWSRLTDRDQVAAGLELLVDHHWLSVRPVVTGGRQKDTYQISPYALNGNCQN